MVAVAVVMPLFLLLALVGMQRVERWLDHTAPVADESPPQAATGSRGPTAERALRTVRLHPHRVMTRKSRGQRLTSAQAADASPGPIE